MKILFLFFFLLISITVFADTDYIGIDGSGLKVTTPSERKAQKELLKDQKATIQGRIDALQAQVDGYKADLANINAQIDKLNAAKPITTDVTNALVGIGT